MNVEHAPDHACLSCFMEKMIRYFWVAIFNGDPDLSVAEIKSQLEAMVNPG